MSAAVPKTEANPTQLPEPQRQSSGKSGQDLSFLLIDDHPIVCSGLAEIIRSSFPECRISVASEYGEALNKVRAETFSLIITDLLLEEQSGLDLIKEIRGFEATVPILVYTFLEEGQYGIRVIKSGATGFLRKCSSVGEILEAVRESLAGGRHFSAEFAKGLVSYICNESGSAPHEALSERELQILRRLGRGEQAKEIAADLGLSAKTVSTYRARIFAKLKFSSAADLVKYCLNERVI